VVGLIHVVRDVTERRRSEEELRKSHEMLRLSQKMEAVGRLAGGVAHDFNNLLLVIGGYSDLLLQRLPPDSEYREDVEEIRKAGTRASSLTQQLLAFSRKQVIAPRVADLNEVVAGMEKMLRRMIGEDIDLVTVLRPGLWNVRVDTGQIEQVLMNLAVNARDAMPGVGKLRIETENGRIDERWARRQGYGEPGEYVVLSVRDTGSGMDEDTLSRVFEPFFSTKGQGKGTGLGLATVYGIVKQSGGYRHRQAERWVYLGGEPPRRGVGLPDLPPPERGAGRRPRRGYSRDARPGQGGDHPPCRGRGNGAPFSANGAVRGRL